MEDTSHKTIWTLWIVTLVIVGSVLSLAVSIGYHYGWKAGYEKGYFDGVGIEGRYMEKLYTDMFRNCIYNPVENKAISINNVDVPKKPIFLELKCSDLQKINKDN